MSTKSKARDLSDLIPILQWLPHYNRTWLSADLIAGLSVWALLVPQGIAYGAQPDGGAQNQRRTNNYDARR